MRQARAIGWAVLLGAGAAAAAVFVAAVASCPGAGDLRPPPCVLVTDRDGEWLRFVPDANGERHLAIPPGPVPGLVRDAFLAAEDRRFFSHPGVDPAAVLRAAMDNLLAGRVVSGASTITMQLCRLARPRVRSPAGKLLEAIGSLRLETLLSKEDILRLYLDRVPLGNNLVGVEAAARCYFGRGCGDLSPAQAALLAALPKAPGALNPWGANLPRLKERRDLVLRRMASMGALEAPEVAEALAEEVVLRPRSFPFEAPHLVDALLANGAGSGGGTVRASVDLDLQRRVEEVLASHRERLAHRGISQAAAVVLDVRGREVLAMAGSLEHGPRDGGYNNGALALRSPGSTLKPFLYALAIDRGITAGDVLEDVEGVWRFPGGEYLPENFNRAAYGPVPLREALGNSLNLAAVRLLERVGHASLFETLRRLGLINHPGLGPGYYGLGLVVGNPEVNLAQLAAAYAALADGGRFRSATLLAGGGRGEAIEVFSAGAAWIISDILADPSSRAVSFSAAAAMGALPGLAIKTGTSTRYRDCWAVGFTPEHVVAVWAGNFDGSATWAMSGATAAAPIVADIAGGLYRLGGPGVFRAPQGVMAAPVCSRSGKLPGPVCPQVRSEWFIAGTEPHGRCELHARGGGRHELPLRYASWLHERWGRGAEGRFRLAGFDEDLDRVFGGDGVEARPAEGWGRGGRVAIVYPLDGDRYVLEAGAREQPVELKAECDGAGMAVSWYVDGIEVASGGPPYEEEWALAPGRHVILAVGSDGTGDEVVVSIE